MPEARALSLDGRNWELQYARFSEAQFCTQRPGVDPSRRFALVATIEEEVVEDGLLTAARVEATLRRHNCKEKPKRRA